MSLSLHVNTIALQKQQIVLMKQYDMIILGIQKGFSIPSMVTPNTHGAVDKSVIINYFTLEV